MERFYSIGIDQSFTSTGIVTLDYDGNLVNHNIVGTLKSDGDYFTRAKMVAEAVANNIDVVDRYIDGNIQVAIEGLAFGMRGTTLQNLAGLQFMIINAIRELGFDVNIYTPSKVKKFATGKGKSDKEELFQCLPEKVQRMFGEITKSNGRYDLTDAYWIARLLWTQGTGVTN